ncbi:MAG: type II-A CRISPR-associated protein Csn2 [Oscillospiraceae bacterium]|nr:type II-A CRISPR-associated protein Csn2 [Oscillospiraceae bacterium]
MKFMFSLLSTPIIFEEGKVQSLVIENQKVFRCLIEDIYNQTKNIEGTSVLSVNNTPVEIKNHAELLTEFVPFDINQKRFLTDICNELEKTALDETNFCVTQELLAFLEKYIQDLAFNLSVDVEPTKLSFPNLLKAMGLTIKDDYVNSIEKLFDYFEMVQGQGKNKLFITVNLRTFFTDEELISFFECVCMHKYNLFMIESSERPILPHEIRLIIDNDLCEI